MPKAVNKVEYNGDTLLDLTSDTVTPQTLLSGATAHAANGQSISGTVDLNGKADKVANATAGNFAGLDSSGNLTDSGKSASDFDNVWLGTRAEHTAAESAGTLPETAIIGITDESGSDSSIIDDEHVSTETTYSSEKIEELFNYVNITWENATDEQIVQALALADAGEFSPANFWAVGDSRTFSLAAISPSTGVDESQDAQDVEMVIVHLGLYKDTNGKTVNAIVQLKNCLTTRGKMNTTRTNAGSWDSCPRRTWCNGNFRDAIPSSIRAIFKQFRTITAKENDSSELTTSIDYFALPAEKEIYGEKKYSTTSEFQALTAWDYYKVSPNRLKYAGSSSTTFWWWLRSPVANSTTNFCFYSTSFGSNNADSIFGLAPFGCI